MAHSTIVGGSSAKRLIACPGSRQLVDRAPPKPTSNYAEEGTMLHEVMHRALCGDSVDDLLADLTEAQAEKIRFALAALDEIDPTKKMEFVTEQHVHFGG